jgi:hypothetical protein
MSFVITLAAFWASLAACLVLIEKIKSIKSNRRLKRELEREANKFFKVQAQSRYHEPKGWRR